MSANDQATDFDVVREVFCRALSDAYHADLDALMAEWRAFKPGFLWWGRALGAFLAMKQEWALRAERERVLAEVEAKLNEATTETFSVFEWSGYRRAVDAIAALRGNG